MSLSQLALTLTQAAEEHGEPAVSPWVVGGVALGILLLVTGWWWLGLVIALALLALKCVSLRWLMQLGLPVPDPAPTVNTR